MYSKNLFRQCLHYYRSSSFRFTDNLSRGQLLPGGRCYPAVQQLVILASTAHFAIFRVPGETKTTRLKHIACQFAPRSAAMSATMAQQEHSVSSNGIVVGKEVTVIRYQLGDERFQMQITLQNGKVFNFERKATDTVANVVARMVANISKKMKKFDGEVRFLMDNGKELDGKEETTEMESLLSIAMSSSGSLKIQVDEHIYTVVMNPPEFYAAKFFNVYMPTFPLFPYRMETSSNFDKMASLYSWEFSRNKPDLGTPPKLRKKSKADGGNIGAEDRVAGSNSWVPCGSSLTFTPEPDMVGGYLKFSCTPSNGTTLGKPFSMVLSNPITPLQVEKFVYQERLSRLKPKKVDANCFRVITYNVLADTYATPEWFISSPKDSLDVGYRLPILNKEIKSYQADLILLQEVDEKFFEGNFEPFMAMQGFKGRHTSKIGNTKEGIATFHNPSKLTEIEFKSFVILDEMKTLPLWQRLEAVGNEFTQRLEERNTVFHISVFKANHCQKKTILVASNVHLYFHPDADHIRLLQTVTCIKILEKTIDRLKYEHPDTKVAVIYSGDLNCTPPFSSYRLLTSGELHENDEDWTSHPEEKISPGISVKHSLNLSNSHPGEELTNITTCFEGCLDYILYQSEHLDLLSTCPPPSKEIIAALTNVDELRKVSLPNFYTPSDHLPLIADFKIK